jgi:hypothetical protein
MEEMIPERYHKYIKDIFEEETFQNKLPPRRPWDHAIDMEEGWVPESTKAYPLGPEEQEEMKSFIQTNLTSGQIRPSISPQASPFFFVRKKDGQLQPVQDYRRLNTKMRRNRYPLPLIQELCDQVKGAKYFSKFDIQWGFNNVRIKDGDEWKAAFRMNMGLFEPTVMFFGLTNSPATFQAMMDEILRILLDGGTVVVYIDNILIFSMDEESHQRTTEQLFKILKDNDLTLKPEKCIFEQPEVEFCGVILGYGKI